MNRKHLMVVYEFTSIIYPNNHVKLSVKNKPQRAGDYFGGLKTK